MKLILSLLNQGLEYEEILRNNLKRIFSLDCHISNYMFSLVYLRKHDPLIKKKMLLYQRMIDAETLEEQKEYFDRILRFKPKEDEIIIECLKKIEEDRKKAKNFSIGRLWKPFTIGIKTIEFESYDG